MDLLDKLENENFKNLIGKWNPRKWTFAGWFSIAIIVPLWVIIWNLLASIFGIGYVISTELHIPEGEERIHNFDSETYYFLSANCTVDLLEIHNVSEEEENKWQWWEGCNQENGTLEISLYRHTSLGIEEEIPNSISCKHQYTALGFGDDQYLYCYGGIILNSSQYSLQNDSPFGVWIIEEDYFKTEMDYMGERTPFVSAGLASVSCCLVLPIFIGLWLYKNPPEQPFSLY